MDVFGCIDDEDSISDLEGRFEDSQSGSGEVFDEVEEWDQVAFEGAIVTKLTSYHFRFQPVLNLGEPHHLLPGLWRDLWPGAPAQGAVTPVR